MNVYLHPPGVICAAGHDLAELREAVFAGQPSGVAINGDVWPGHELHLGAVRAALPSVDALPLPQRSRNNALLLAALPATVDPDYFLFIAAVQFPIYLIPTLTQPIYRRLLPHGR